MGRPPKRARGKDLYIASPAHKRNALQRESDTWWAVRELARGRTYREIAEDLSEKTGIKLSHMQIWNDIEKVLVEWKRNNMENVEAYIAKDLARLERIEEIVLQNFEKSKLPSPLEYATMMKRGFTPEEVDQMFEERGGRAGDPRYIDTLLRVQAQRLRLLGIDKGNDVPQQNVVQYNFNNVDLGDLASIADKLQDSKKEELVDEQ